MDIRAVIDDDKEEWKRLFRAYGVFYETVFDDDILHRVWSWLRDDAHEVSGLVALDDGVIIGFAHYRRLADTFTGGPAWSLDDLFVEGFARGKGAATALLASVEDHARTNGGGTLRWITAADNATAQSLYDKVATRTTWVTYEKELG